MAENNTPIRGSERGARRRWPLTRTEVRSADGTAIAAYASPADAVSPNAPLVVLAGDLAETIPEVWKPQVEYLTGARFLAWEYRGTRRPQGDAESPKGARRYDVNAHLEDLCAVLRDLGGDESTPFTMMGSGVGVRVAIEAALTMPQRVNGLVLIGGAAGLRYDLLCRVSFAAARFARRASEPATRRLSARARHRGERVLVSAMTHGVDRAMQLADMSLLAPTRDNMFVTLDAIASTLRELGTREAIEQAGRIHVPALVLCGSEDKRMPAALAHMLARRIDDSRVRIVPNSRSRLAAELPDFVNLELERFLRRIHTAPASA